LDVSFTVEPGEVVALVGRSGAGKSTLANLIPRLYDPTSGVVWIDDLPAGRYPLDRLRKSIGVVPQEIFLFNRTIQENIAFARPDAVEAEIFAAARAAHAHEFIERLEHGYATLVGERGVKLSGGQKQRIAIAREILRNPAILILDEATSSLDTESEALIKDAVERLKQHRTCFVIAHRLSTVQDADRILVLEQGRIVEEGSHAALMERGGSYRRLYDSQFLV
jgi:ABC-type multidrug transport system fused ATPase/permease subunit